jgi:hypothetical protein
MGRIKSQRAPTGTRNHAFFPQLSGLQRALDNIVDNTPRTEEPTPVSVAHDKISKAQAKRMRRMERNKQLMEKGDV